MHGGMKTMHGEDNTDHDPSMVVEYGGGMSRRNWPKHYDRHVPHSHFFYSEMEILKDRNTWLASPAHVPTNPPRPSVVVSCAASPSGLTLEELATDLGMSYRTVRRAFAGEIKTARVRVRLDTVDLLHKAANGGNVSAMKTLLEMTDRWRPDLDGRRGRRSLGGRWS